MAGHKVEHFSRSCGCALYHIWICFNTWTSNLRLIKFGWEGFWGCYFCFLNSKIRIEKI